MNLNLIQRLAITMVLAGAHALAAAQQANVPTMLILDASNSMWGQIGREAKIDIARRALRDHADSLPADQPLGLVAYGHRRKDDCGDVETVLPVERGNQGRIEAALKSLTPRGKTPLAKAIVHAADALDARNRPGRIVVVTDGLETCHADPCAEVKAAVKAAKQLTVHVVGLDMRAAEREQLQCIATAGGGVFALAGSAQDLALALQGTEKQAARQPVREAGALTVAPERPKAGSRFQVTWSGAAQEGDVVTLSLPEVPMRGGTAFAYHVKKNTASIVAPDTPGRYELRFLGKSGKELLGKTAVTIDPAEATVEAPPTVAGNVNFEVKWTGPANAGDQIVLVETESGSTQRKAIAYANASAGSPAKLRAPAESGEFEVQYVSGRRQPLARQRLTVAMQPVALSVAPVVQRGAPLIVGFTGSTGAGDRVSYSPVTGAKAAGRTYYNVSAGAPARLVAPDVPGTYTVEYRTGPGATKVLATATFEVR